MLEVGRGQLVENAEKDVETTPDSVSLMSNPKIILLGGQWLIDERKSSRKLCTILCLFNFDIQFYDGNTSFYNHA